MHSKADFASCNIHDGSAIMHNFLVPNTTTFIILNSRKLRINFQISTFLESGLTPGGGGDKQNLTDKTLDWDKEFKMINVVVFGKYKKI